MNKINVYDKHMFKNKKDTFRYFAGLRSGNSY